MKFHKFHFQPHCFCSPEVRHFYTIWAIISFKCIGILWAERMNKTGYKDCQLFIDKIILCLRGLQSVWTEIFSWCRVNGRTLSNSVSSVQREDNKTVTSWHEVPSSPKKLPNRLDATNRPLKMTAKTDNAHSWEWQ